MSKDKRIEVECILEILAERLAALEVLTERLSIEEQGGIQTLVIEDVNVQVRSSRGTPGTGNLIIGSNHHYAAAIGSFAVGEGHTLSGSGTVVVGGRRNQASEAATVVGGMYNRALQVGSTVVGGQENVASGARSVVAGGHGNAARGSHSLVMGGRQGTASALDSIVVGGESNGVTASYGVAVAGRDNTVDGDAAVGLGGNANQVSGAYAATLGGHRNKTGSPWSIAVGGRDGAVDGIFGTNLGGEANHTLAGLAMTIGGTQQATTGHRDVIIDGHRLEGSTIAISSDTGNIQRPQNSSENAAWVVSLVAAARAGWTERQGTSVQAQQGLELSYLFDGVWGLGVSGGLLEDPANATFGWNLGLHGLLRGHTTLPIDYRLGLFFRQAGHPFDAIGQADEQQYGGELSVTIPLLAGFGAFAALEGGASERRSGRYEEGIFLEEAEFRPLVAGRAGISFSW